MMEKLLLAYFALGALIFLACLLNGVVGKTWHELRCRYYPGTAAVIQIMTVVYLVTLWPIPLAQVWRRP